MRRFFLFLALALIIAGCDSGGSNDLTYTRKADCDIQPTQLAVDGAGNYEVTLRNQEDGPVRNLFVNEGSERDGIMFVVIRVETNRPFFLQGSGLPDEIPEGETARATDQTSDWRGGAMTFQGPEVVQRQIGCEVGM